MDPYRSINLLTETVSSTQDYSTVWGMPSWVAWLIIAILLLVSGLFSASENAYSNCNKYHFKNLASKGKLTAKLICWLIDKFDNTLITVLVGNNIVQTLMSFLSAILFYNLCAYYGLGSGVEAILSTVVMAFLVYIISDTCPKILSKAIPNRMAYILAYPVGFTFIILWPVIMIFKGILWLVYKIFRIKDDNLLSKEDLLHSADVAINDEVSEDEPEEQLFESDEKELLDNALTFDTIKVKDVYTPMDKVLSISIDNLTINRVNQIITNTKYSRIPVYDEDETNIVGILVVKTYFEEYTKDNHLDIRSILIDPIFVDVNDPIDDVFKWLNKEKTHLAIVTDNKKMVGIISMEDILEELVEDIDEKPVRKERLAR